MRDKPLGEKEGRQVLATEGCIRLLSHSPVGFHWKTPGTLVSTQGGSCLLFRRKGERTRQNIANRGSTRAAVAIAPTTSGGLFWSTRTAVLTWCPQDTATLAGLGHHHVVIRKQGFLTWRLFWELKKKSFLASVTISKVGI